VLLGQSRGFGFNPFSAIKTAAKDVYHVAQDPRAQALVAAGAQAYAPDQTSEVMQFTHQVQSNIRRARRFMDQGRVITVPAGQAPPAGAVPMDDGGGGGGGLPVEKSHMLLYAGAAGAALILILLLKR
jgi:hypothetical protein